MVKRYCYGCHSKYSKKINHCCKCKIVYPKHYKHCCDCKMSYDNADHCCKCKMNYNEENHCCGCKMNYHTHYTLHCCECKINYTNYKSYLNKFEHCCIHKYYNINTCGDCIMIYKKIYEYVMIELKYHPRNVAKFLEENTIEDLDNM